MCVLLNIAAAQPQPPHCGLNDQGVQETRAGMVAVVLEVSNAGCPEKSEKQISAMMAISTPAATKSRKVSSNQMTSFLACLF